MRAKIVAMIAFVVAALAAPAYAQVKYVAVVETELDAQSGAAAEMNQAEVRQITAELRREAVEILPAGKYNIMTSETVQAQGGAVLEACADENCVITLGSKIGADFIVRGIISKFRAKFTLTVEMYETENGNLVATSDPVRSEDVGDLLEQSGAAVSNMYKKFAEKQSQIAQRKPVTEIDDMDEKPAASVPAPETPKAASQKTSSKWFGIGGGLLYAGDFGGGVSWGDDNNGYQIFKMPYNTGGAYIFLDVPFVTVSIAYTLGGGKWETPNDGINPNDLPYMSRSALSFGAAVKYTNLITLSNTKNKINIYPILGIDYEISMSGELKFDGRAFVFGVDAFKIKNAGGEEMVTGVSWDALSAMWVKAGGGIDFYLAENTFLRLEMLYGFRTANGFEEDTPNPIGEHLTRLGHGLTVRAGAGFKL